MKLVLILVLVLGAGTGVWLGMVLRVRTETAVWARSSIADVPVEAWQALAQKRVFFGHKSVGRNLMQGVAELQAEHSFLAGLKLEHASVGENFQPATKLEGFEAALAEKPSVEWAMLKFCYADVNKPADADRLLARYQAARSRLRKAYPHVEWIHFTLPIEAPQRGASGWLKEAVKRVLGKPGVAEKNAARWAYSRALKEAAGEERVFDIAAAESVGPDGRRYYRRVAGEKVYCMAPAYTNDGGHLNALGRRMVAEQFLVQLAAWALADQTE